MDLVTLILNPICVAVCMVVSSPTIASTGEGAEMSQSSRYISEPAPFTVSFAATTFVSLVKTLGTSNRLKGIIRNWYTSKPTWNTRNFLRRLCTGTCQYARTRSTEVS